MNSFDSHEKTPTTRVVTRVFSALFLGALTANAVAQSQSIILNTSPTPTEVELLDGTDVNLDPLTGNLTATPLDPNACSATTDCTDVQVSVESFVVSPSTVNQGQNVQFSWSARGAWECQGSGLPGTTWNGTKAPSGSQFVSTAAVTPDTYTVTLDCNNGPVTDSRTANVTVETGGGGGGGGVPQFCFDEGRVPPAGLTQDTQLIVGSSQVTETWQQAFGNAFPNGNERDMSILNDRYASLEFTVPPQNGTTGRVTFDALQTFISSGSKIVTISECPGDFTSFNNNCSRFISQSAIRWAIGSGGGFDCVLTPNTTYYLNILYTGNDDPPYNDWSCTGSGNPDFASECGDIVKPLLD